MSVKKQIFSSCKLFSIYEELPEEFLNKTDVDRSLYRNIFDISESQHRKVRVCKGTNKKSMAIKLILFCDLKTQQPFILHEEVIFSKRVFISLVDSLRDLIKSVIVYDFRHRNPISGLHLQNQKTVYSLNTMEITLNVQIDKFVYRSDLQTTIFAPLL